MKKPALSKKNIKARLKFAREHKNWSLKQWYRVLWTDESKFELLSSKRRIYVRRHPGERYHRQCIVPTMKHGGGSVMVWGSISAFGVGPLHHVKGILVKEGYKQILIHHGVPGGRHLITPHYSLQEPFIFQEDNDPKHSSKICREYLDRKETAGKKSVEFTHFVSLNFNFIKLTVSTGELVRMRWPAQSPDLNPIEQIWEALDKKVQQMGRMTMASLFDNLRKAWNSIGAEELRKYIDSMPRRCAAVIQAKGGHIDY